MPGITIGPITIQYYGIILMLGALAGAWLAAREARRRGLDPEMVWDGLVWVLVGGIIGARLWHVFTPTQVNVAEGLTTAFYLTHPLDLINIKKGGLGIPGAVIGGGLALYFFCRRRKADFLTWTDLAVPGLALGQVIGRWGNFVNQELYGAPTSLPWAIRIENPLPGYEAFATFHPLFLYESLWNLGLMGLLLWLGRRYADRLKRGDLLLVYLIGYPTARFFLEFLRLDIAEVGGLNANQVVMAVVALAAAALLFLRHRRGAAGPAVAPAQAAAETDASAGAQEFPAPAEREEQQDMTA